MNSILQFVTDTTVLGVWFLGLSLAVAALTSAMHAGYKFLTVDHLPVGTAIALALIYPLAGPARVIRFLYRDRQREIALTASIAAHPAGKGRALAASKAAHPAGKGRVARAERHLSLIANQPGDVA